MDGATRSPHYFLALEVTNLRLAVELAASALRLGRIREAQEHLEAVEAPGRRVLPSRGRGTAVARQGEGLLSRGRAAGDWRYTRPSLLVEIVQERVRKAA